MKNVSNNLKILLISILILSLFFILISMKVLKENHEIKINQKDNNNVLNRIKYPILYINLDRSDDRKVHMETQFAKYNIKNYQRVQAIDGKEIYNMKGQEIADIKFINNYKIGTKSELACTLSHLKAINYAYLNNYESVLILEDDCSLDLMEKWKDDLDKIVEKAPKDWEIIQLYISRNCIKGIEHKIIKRINNECYGSVSYLLNRKGMQTILENSFFNGIFILGKVVKDRIYPERIVSDYFIYRVSKHVYLYAFPIFITNNEILESTIHPEKTANHKNTANYYKHIYNITDEEKF